MKCYFGIALIALVMLCAAQSVPLQGKKGGVCNKDCSDDVSGPYCKGKEIFQFGDCQMDQMKCLVKKTGKELPKTLQDASKTNCPECAKRCFPSKDGSPLECDSKGGIHDSECMFKNAKCIDDSLQLGVCPECVKRCSPPKDGSKPVCDSKRGIHDSVCMFRNAKCIDDSLRRVKCRPGKPRT